MIELASSKIKSYILTLYKGEAVIRNQNRINGLIGVRQCDIPSQYHGLLAKAEFTGGFGNEKIIWNTDVFHTEPKRLSELNASDKAHYKNVLDNALASYASAISSAEKNVRDLLYAAITYPSENSVFCADDRVVITEWGMTPVGEQGIIGMPYSIDDVSRPNHGGSKTEDDNNESKEQRDIAEENSENQDSLQTEESLETSGKTDSVSEDGEGSAVHPVQEGLVPPLPPTPPAPPITPGPPDTPDPKNKWWKRWWAWLLWLLLLLLLILLVCCLLKGCASSKPIEETAPALSKEDVVLSEDSLRYVAGNRLILLISSKPVDIDGFSKDFRKKYPDTKKYILSNADTVIGRVTLTLPSEERVEMTDRLPAEFPEYGIIVIPETMYKSDVSSNDPAMQDQEKRWYFDECSVLDAWNDTQGDKEIIVAVIDDGFDLNHPELRGKIVKPYNAVTHNTDITPSASGHGTHVAATAVGNANNSAGLAGIAPNCKLMPIQVGDANGNMSSTAIFDAVMYAIQNGADVVNMSLGMYFGPTLQFLPVYMQKNLRANTFLQEQRVWEQIFEVARQNNVTFVLAGGNENILVGIDPMSRSANTIKVSATQPDRYKAGFSNYGDMSTVSAPGVHIFNAIPGNRYTYMDGTSMASPVVAGGCALLKSKYRGITTAEIIDILRNTGNPSGSDVGPIVNFAKALDTAPGSGSGAGDECLEASRRYQELLSELEKLKREHPGCIQEPDTLELPVDFTPRDLTGRWKSTTSLYNQEEEEVVIYFTFNGTSVGRLDIVEPSGERFTAPLNVAVNNNVADINQTAPASGSVSGRGYSPYRFVLRPGMNRKAEGNARNKEDVANVFEFNLIQI